MDSTLNKNKKIEKKYTINTKAIEELVDEERDMSISKTINVDTNPDNNENNENDENKEIVKTEEKHSNLDNEEGKTKENLKNNIEHNLEDYNKDSEVNQDFIKDEDIQKFNEEEEEIKKLREDFSNQMERRKILDAIRPLDTTGSRFEEFIFKNLIPEAFNKIFGELLSKNIKPDDFYAYASSRLCEISENLESELKNFEFK